MGRRPMMEMVQQLFKLQISHSFSGGSYIFLLVFLFFLFFSLFLTGSNPNPNPWPCPLYPPTVSCRFLNLCHLCLPYVPGDSSNSIRGTCLTNVLPLSVSFHASTICGAVCLFPHFLQSDQYPQKQALQCPAGRPCRRWS